MRTVIIAWLGFNALILLWAFIRSRNPEKRCGDCAHWTPAELDFGKCERWNRYVEATDRACPALKERQE